VILKFFLNVSKEEQRERFLERLDEPAKNWKFSLADISERALWGKYQAAYQELVRHTSTAAAPWHVVPADHKWFARVVIGSTIVSALDALDLKFPKADAAALQEFKQVRKALLQEGKGGTKKAVAGKAANK
jgi:polyphosphate kinase 2 (PPK2 family)